MTCHLCEQFVYSNAAKIRQILGLGNFSACKVTHRAIFDVDFSAENFQLPLSPYKIGDADLSQPAF